MKKSLGPFVLALLAASCGSETPTAPVVARVTPSPVPAFNPTPTPTATPRPTTLIGFWKIANPNTTSDPINGYGIDITSHVGNDIRGRSVYPYDYATGLLIGTVKTSGKVEWRVEYVNGSENGSMQWDQTRGTLTGDVYFEVTTPRYNYTYRGVVLRRELQ